MIFHICLVFFVLLSGGYCQGSDPNAPVPGFNVDSETRLRRDLLTNYSAKIRPNGISVAFLTFNLLSINDLDTRTQMLSVSGYFTVVWLDNRLRWNSTEYSDIVFIFSDETEVWRPALVVKNAINDISVISDEEVPFRIDDHGTIFWNPPGIYKTNCDIDTTYYPFDTQFCSVVVQSWGYNLKELDLIKYGTGIETNEFQINGEWDLLKSDSKRAERLDGTDTYATVSFDFTLKRRTAYYALNIILPVIVLSSLSALVFRLPADSGEKIGYSLTVLLSFAVFLTLISERMPTTSKNTSYMALYLSSILCLNGLSVLLTIFILELYFREEPVPAWLSTFTRRFLMPLVCSRGCLGNNDMPEDMRLKTRTNSEGLALAPPVVWSEKETRTLPVARCDRDKGEVTWKNISQCADAFCFRIHVVAIVLVHIVVYGILGANA